MLIKENKEIFLLISFFTLLRLWVAPSFGLGVDEAHYLLYAKYLDLSYVDHPPLVGWIHAPFYYLLGTSEFLVRLPAILLFACTSFLAYRFMMGISNSKGISLLAVLGLNSSFMFNALGLMLLPDSILLVLVFLLILVIQKIEEKPQPKYFIFLGLLWGLAGLAKYTSALLVPALLFYWLSQKRYDLLFSKHMIACAAIALLLIAPVLYWNLQNNWVSFRYQGTHMFGSSAIKLGPFFLSLAAQLGSYSPFLFGIAFYGFFRSFRSTQGQIRLSLLLGGIPLAFFLY
ncbi:MAG: glycosyltransferase family 39 protein, partial [Deltaproteobacteria bacterium]|nr:glycosyltransferase family 39 protein [Deltaproteobacteria bacterium]